MDSPPFCQAASSGSARVRAGNLQPQCAAGAAREAIRSAVSRAFHRCRTRGRLRTPVICGMSDHKPYILETIGCGAAFLDYDNDGWIDILVLSGSQMDIAPEATDRLYR